MVKPREGHHVATLQIPLEMWEALCREAEETPAAAGSTNRMAALILGERYGLDAPPRRKAGRKPTRPAEPPPDAARKGKGKR